MGSRPTASIVVIGDEILKGQTRDTNSHFLSHHLYQCGVKVEKISIVPDDVNVIAEEISALSKRCTYILTSGGIGPTHDDVTYAGIAKAFGEKLIENKELEDTFRKLGCSDNIAVKLSVVPESSCIHHTETSAKTIFEPIVAVKNVYIFPGIPSYLECAFLYLKPLFMCDSVFYHKAIYLSISEFQITDPLNKVVEQFGEHVRFGSYPYVENTVYQVKLMLEADSENALEDAEAYLRSTFPSNVIISSSDLRSSATVRELCEIVTVKNCHIDKKFVSVVKETINTIEECLKRYGPNGTCLSFNGGKDCTAVLHLTSCLFIKNGYSCKLKTLYIRNNESFPEIEDFIKLSIQRYNLDVITYELPMIDALAKLKTDHPEVVSVLIGTRNTDPHASQLSLFQMTDANWPKYMRVSPLLHWSYHDVWKFIRLLNIPYCSLYDQGYTSLGCKNSTVKNPNLKMTTGIGETFYGPAYLLKEPTEEREGRVSNV